MSSWAKAAVVSMIAVSTAASIVGQEYYYHQNITKSAGVASDKRCAESLTVGCIFMMLVAVCGLN
jgi:hypothetical protein